jgi:hypothetical protein
MLKYFCWLTLFCGSLWGGNVSIFVFNKYCDPIRFAEARVFVNGSRVSFDFGADGEIQFKSALESFTVGVRIAGFKYQTKAMGCGSPNSSCNAALFLDIQPIGSEETSDEKKMLILPSSWIRKGIAYVRVIGVEGYGEVAFSGKEVTNLRLPVAWSGTTVVFVSFKNGSKASALFDLDSGNRRIEVEARPGRSIELEPKTQFN